MVRDTPSLVDPLLGTAVQADRGEFSRGHTFPGATLPFGMVQAGPVTATFAERTWDEHRVDRNNYEWEAERINGFVTTLISGTGGSVLGDVVTMPICSAPDVSPGSEWVSFGQGFSHEDERATPGRYSVRLECGVRVEHTATARTAMTRIDYPAEADAGLLINVGVDRNREVLDSRIEVAEDGAVHGWVESGRFWSGRNIYRVYFALEADSPVIECGVWDGEHLRPGRRQAGGRLNGGYLMFGDTAGRAVQIKIGISYVSIYNAKLNLRTENAGWDFEATSLAARESWRERLDRIEVEGATPEQLIMLYTALYHAMLHPNVFNDVNGDYIGFDKAVHNTEGEFTKYVNFSGWDVYRAQFPLLALLDPKLGSDIATSLVEDARQAGSFPRWSVANDDSGVMIGEPAVPSIAALYAFGARDFPVADALSIMIRSATVPGIRCNHELARPDLANMLEFGYVPEDRVEWRSPASTTLEYATADFALSCLAAACGDEETASGMLRRSGSWRNIFREDKGYLWPRNADGSWVEPFDPKRPRWADEIGFCEGNSDTYTLTIVHDMAGAIELIGGDDEVADRLDHHDYSDMDNEPAHIIPWVYHYLGKPYRTRQQLDTVLEQFFGVGPDGLPGEDDLGHMSAWVVWSMIGLYPAMPGQDVLLLAGPTLGRVGIDLGGGRRLTLSRSGDGDRVTAVEIEGRDESRSWIRYAEIAGGGNLEFTWSDADNGWGSDPALRPPSFPPNGTLPAPSEKDVI